MRYTSIVIFLFIYSLAGGQSPIPADSIFSLIKNRSILSKNADWPKVKKNYDEKLSLAKNQEDTLNDLLSVLESLGDVHSQINYQNRSYGNYPDFDAETMQYLVPLVNRSNEEVGIIRTSLLNGDIGYIRIPGIQAWGEKVNEYAQVISDSICSLQNRKAKGFIIDLRLNGGGQIAAMVGGLNQLLGNNYLGGGIDISEKETQRFDIRATNFYLNDFQLTNIKNKCKTDLSKTPVVLIIGPATRSSGSITAAAFKGRPNTYFIGEPTADGYTTGNEFFNFGTDISINLSVSNTIDRNKNVYKYSVPPDIIIKGSDNFENLAADVKVIAALQWLKENDK